MANPSRANQPFSPQPVDESKILSELHPDTLTPIPHGVHMVDHSAHEEVLKPTMPTELAVEHDKFTLGPTSNPKSNGLVRSPTDAASGARSNIDPL